MEFLSGWVYGSVLVTFIGLIVVDFFDLAYIAEKKCPICKKSFGDIFGLKKHIKAVETNMLKKAA